LNPVVFVQRTIPVVYHTPKASIVAKRAADRVRLTPVFYVDRFTIGNKINSTVPFLLLVLMTYPDILKGRFNTIVKQHI